MSEYLDDKGKSKKSSPSKNHRTPAHRSAAQVPKACTTTKTDASEKASIRTSAMPAPSYGDVSNSAFRASVPYNDEQYWNRRTFQENACPSTNEADVFPSHSCRTSATSGRKSVDRTTVMSPSATGARRFETGTASRRHVLEEEIELFAESPARPVSSKTPASSIAIGSAFRATVRAIDESSLQSVRHPSSVGGDDDDNGDGAFIDDVVTCSGNGEDCVGSADVRCVGRGGRRTVRSRSDCSPWRQSAALPTSATNAVDGLRQEWHNNHHEHRHQQQVVVEQRPTQDAQAHEQTGNRPTSPVASCHVSAPKSCLADGNVSSASRQLQQQQPDQRLQPQQQQQHCDTFRHSPEEPGSSTTSTSGTSTTPPMTAPSALPSRTPWTRTTTAVCPPGRNAPQQQQQRLQNPQCHHPVGFAIHASPAMESDLNEIKSMLNLYMRRLDNKDTSAKVTKEWRVVARVFDRLFFYTYCATILVSLATIFPRAHD